MAFLMAGKIIGLKKEQVRLGTCSLCICLFTFN